MSDGTVLVGVSADEASRYLRAALTTLSGLGADVSDVGWRGAWVFVAEIGNPSKTVLDKELTEAAANARQPYVNVSFAGAYKFRSIVTAAQLSSYIKMRSLRPQSLSSDISLVICSLNICEGIVMHGRFAFLLIICPMH